MPTVVQFRRGTTAQNDVFVGAAGELSVDTEKDVLRVHDGTTAGGYELLTLNATQTITNKTPNQDWIPASDSAYDLGSPTNKWKDLYLSGNSIYLGDAKITSLDSAVILPAGSSILGGGSVLDSDKTNALITSAINNLVDGAPDALNTLNELAAAINDDSNFAANITSLITSLPDSAQTRGLFSAGTGLSYNSGTGEFSIPTSGVAAGTYGSASLVPVITVDAQGFVDSVGEVSVAGVSNFDYDSATGQLTISTADGGTYAQTITFDPFSTTDLAEGNNLYYTTVRADSDFDVRLATKTTTDVAEGTNLYYTSARADSDAKNAVSAGTGLSYNSGTGEFSVPASGVVAGTYGSASLVPVITVDAQGFVDSVGEVSVAGVSSTSFDSATGVFTINTADGGSYATTIADSDFTAKRARESVSVTDAGGDGSLTYNSGTGVFTYTGPSAAEVRAHFSAGTGVTLSSGEISIGQPVDSAADVVFGSLETVNGLIVGGDLQVNGTTTTVNAQNLEVTDNMIYMNAGESAGSPTLSVDVGWAANVNDDGSYAHVGMFRDATDNTFKIFEGYTPEPDSAPEINTAHASFSLAPFAARTITGKYLGADSDIDARLSGGTGITYSSGTISTNDAQIVHDNLSGFVANEHIDHSTVSITAGSGLTGGGTIAATRTLNIGEGTGITVSADAISTNDAEIIHDNLSGFVANEHIDHSGVSITAGNGLTGGGDLTSTRTLNVVGGGGINVNADNITIDSAEIRALFSGSSGITYNSTTGAFTHSDTSSASSVNNSGNTFIQDITIDGNGHVTAIGSGTVSINDATITVSAGVGLSGGGDFTTNQSGNETITLTLDMSELTDMTDTMVGTDEFIVLDAGADRRKAASEIGLSIFNNDAGFTTYDSGNATGQINTAIANLIDNAPAALDTLNELAAALGDDANFSTTVTNAIAALPDSAQVRGLLSGSTGITYNSTTGAISTNDGQIVHDNLSGFVANEHIDHSGVSITAGSGLTGGGDITTSRTLNIGEGTGITVSADAISTNDAEIVHDNLSGFVANEHIDHSGVTITAGTGLTGGGDITTSRTISHADTSSQASVNNSGNTFVQDITLDGFGHITAITSAEANFIDSAALTNGSLSNIVADSATFTDVNFVSPDGTHTITATVTNDDKWQLLGTGGSELLSVTDSASDATVFSVFSGTSEIFRVDDSAGSTRFAIYDDNSNELFRVDDTTSGVIFTVYDRLGNVAISVDSDQNVSLNKSAGYLLVGTDSATDTNVLQVNGGITISGYGEVIDSNGDWTGLSVFTSKTTTDLAEGTNLYYTTSRADSDFDVRLATKTTTDIAEGTNLYYTKARVDSDVNAGITALIDGAPTALDTLNELAAALNDDANFAATITAQLDALPDSAQVLGLLSGGTGVTYNSGTGEIAIGQDVATTADVTFNSVTFDNHSISSQTATTTTTSQTAIATFSAASYKGADVTVTAVDGTKTHMSRFSIIHNGTTASASEYGIIYTDSSLASFAVDINSGDVRLLATPATSNSTVFKAALTLMDA